MNRVNIIEDMQYFNIRRGQKVDSKRWSRYIYKIIISVAFGDVWGCSKKMSCMKILRVEESANVIY